MAPEEGYDPPTFRVTTECSTSWATLELKMATSERIELSLSNYAHIA